MTPPLDLVQCTHCDCWFTAGATDELFHHATGRCRRRESPPPESGPAFTDSSPA